MKKWNNAEIVDLSINETAHGWTGIYRDGGYIGDGQISGHLKWERNCPGQGGNTGNTGNNNPS